MVATHPEHDPAPLAVPGRRAAEVDGLRPVRGVVLGLVVAATSWALPVLVVSHLVG